MSEQTELFGGNLLPGVIDQINKRQEKLGKNNLNSEEVVINNSKTAWVRLASSVELSQGMEQAGLGNFTNTNGPLANEFVLSGGVISERGVEPISDLSPYPSYIRESVNSHYGIGDNTKWGYSAQPGITSVEIKSMGGTAYGSTRKADILITAHNPDQFNLIETLYLKLGFTMLVEWGHAMYYDNEGTVQNMDFNTKPFREFLNTHDGGNEAVLEIHNTILKERKKHSYNYDAFIGYVVNFDWSIGEEGVYNIHLQLISFGSLIESLRISKGSDIIDTGDEKDNAIGNILESYLTWWKRVFNESKKLDIIENVNLGRDVENAFRFGGQVSTPPSGFINLVGESADNEFKFKLKRKGEILKQSYNSSDNQNKEEEYYISLGALLRLIEEAGLYYDKDGKSFITISHEYGKSFMLSHPYQQSVNPNICILSSEFIDYGGELEQYNTSQEAAREEAAREEAEFIDKATTQQAESLATNIFVPDEVIYGQANAYGEDTYVNPLDTLPLVSDVYPPSSSIETPTEETSSAPPPPSEELVKDKKYPLNQDIVLHFKDYNDNSSFSKNKADIMGIMINFNYIIQNATSANGDTSIYDFLTTLLRSIENCIGEINELLVVYDEDIRKIIIIDNRVLPTSSSNTSNKKGSFHISGFDSQYNLGSFVKNINMQSKLTPEITNLVIAGAQTSTVCPDEVSTLQIINRGLKDRVVGGLSTYKNSQTANQDTLIKYYSQIKELNKFFVSTYTKKQSINKDYGANLRDVLYYDLQKRVLNDEMVSPFPLPVSINLTTEGLSGLKLNQTFDITPRYILPSSYAGINYVIMSLNHTLKDNEWTTSLEALCQPSLEAKEWKEDPSLFKGGSDSSVVDEIFEEPPKPSEWETFPNAPSAFLQFAGAGKTSVFEVLNLLHPSVRPQWDGFLSDLLASPNLKGYKIVISSHYRDFAKQEELVNSPNSVAASVGNSPHNFGVALDINIFRANPEKGILKFSTPNKKWLASGVPIIAEKHNFRWGGKFSKRDAVHFDPAAPSVAGTPSLTPIVNKTASREALTEYAKSIGKNSFIDLTQQEVYEVDLILNA